MAVLGAEFHDQPSSTAPKPVSGVFGARTETVSRKRVWSDTRKRETIGALIGLFLSASTITFARSRSQAVGEATFLALMLPAFLQIRWKMVDLAAANRVFVMTLPFLIPVGISFLLDQQAQSDEVLPHLIVLANTTMALYLGALVATCPGEPIWPVLMRWLALFMGPYFSYVLISQRNATVWGRWQPYALEPNWWGMMALALAWASFEWRRLYVRLPALLIASYVLYRAQARGSELALVVAFILSSGYFLPFDGERIRKLASALFVMLLVSLILFMMPTNDVGDRFLSFLTDDIMRLHDSQRGIGSGMSGRTEGYRIAYEAFSESPFFGKGFREYEFVHNCFMLVLAESGIFALGGLLFIFGAAIMGFLRWGNWAAIGYILSYIVCVMTFPRSINVNMTGMVFIFIMMHGILQLLRKREIVAEKIEPLIRFGAPLAPWTSSERPLITIGVRKPHFTLIGSRVGEPRH